MTWIDWQASKTEMLKDSAFAIGMIVVAYLITKPVTGTDWGGTTIMWFSGVCTYAFFKNLDDRHNKKMKKSDNIENSELWYNKGVDFSNSKDYYQALMAYDKALTFNDKDPDIWNNKCYILTKLGQCEEAIKAGNIAVELAPNDPVLWDTLRDAYIGCNNQEKADECQKNVIKLRENL